MNLALFIILASSCFALAVLNGFYQNREKVSGVIFCIVTPLAFFTFALLSGHLSSVYNALYMSVCLAIAFYLSTEACSSKTKEGVILSSIFRVASLVMLVLGSISLAPFTIFGLLGGFMLGAGFGFTVFIACKNQTLFKKCVYFIELLMGGALFGCSISSVALSTHLLASILYLVGASLIFIRYILRTYFEHSGVFRVITRILFGIAMISIISSIFFY